MPRNLNEMYIHEFGSGQVEEGTGLQDKWWNVAEHSTVAGLFLSTGDQHYIP
jgi:hypothetical protein